MPKKGITLLAFGHPAYGAMAHNLAVSLKIHSDLPIQLIAIPKTLSHLDEWQKDVFDYIDDFYYSWPANNPPYAKLHSFYQFRFDETIFLDVDALAMQDVKPLFKECNSSYHAQTYTLHDLSEGDNPKHQWADLNVVKKKYSLSGKFPIISTAFQYVRDTKKVKRIFERAMTLLRNEKMNGLRNKWGKFHPDELYMSIALTEEGHDPTPKETPEPVYFTETQVKPTKQILNEHYLIGFGTDRTHRTLKRLYDMKLKHYYQNMYFANPIFKSNFTFDNKMILNP